jgi:hypothetical protein
VVTVSLPPRLASAAHGEIQIPQSSSISFIDDHRRPPSDCHVLRAEYLSCRLKMVNIDCVGLHVLLFDGFFTTCNVIRTFDKQKQFCKHLGKNDYSKLFLAENFNFLCQAMASSGSAAHIANVSGDTSSESATSARSAPAARRSLTRTQRHWTTAAVVTPQMCSPSSTILGLCASQKQRREKRILNVSYTTVSHAV